MNLLVTGAWHEAREYTGELENLGHKVQMLQWEKDPLPCAYEWVEGMICNGLFLHHPIELFPNLRYIQLTSAGYDRVPLDYIDSHGIELHNARDVYSIPMAEHAVSGVLQLYRQTRVFDRNQREHRWEKIRNLSELYGKTVCIVGCGSVGTECAKRFHAFGCRVIGVSRHTVQRLQTPYSKYTSPGLDNSGNVIYYNDFESILPDDSIDRILPETDIMIISIPLTEKTWHLIDHNKLVRLKKSTIVVNLARGAIIDTEALRSALQDGYISGAVLDVFEEEPLSKEDPFWGMDNVILTPHNSFAGEGNTKRLSHLILENINSLC